MTDYVKLLGAEQAEQAARNISGAAETFSQAVARLETALFAHQQFLTEWLSRLEETLRPKEAEAEPTLCSRCGGIISRNEVKAVVKQTDGTHKTYHLSCSHEPLDRVLLPRQLAHVWVPPVCAGCGEKIEKMVDAWQDVSEHSINFYHLRCTPQKNLRNPEQ